MLEHSSAHHTSAAGGNKGPPFASHPRTIRRSPEGTRVPPLLQLLRPSTTVTIVATLNYGYNCCDPQLRLQLLRPSTTVTIVATLNYGYNCCDPQLRLQLLRPSTTVTIVATRRRKQGSPLCFASSHHPSVAGGNKGPPFASHPRTIRRSPEGTRVPPLLQLLRPAAADDGGLLDAVSMKWAKSAKVRQLREAGAASVGRFRHGQARGHVPVSLPVTLARISRREARGGWRPLGRGVH